MTGPRLIIGPRHTDELTTTTTATPMSAERSSHPPTRQDAP